MTRWPRLVGESSGSTAVPSVRPAGLRAVQCEGGGARSASPRGSAGSSIFGEETRQVVQTLQSRYRAERPANRVSPGRSYAVHPCSRANARSRCAQRIRPRRAGFQTPMILLLTRRRADRPASTRAGFVSTRDDRRAARSIPGTRHLGRYPRRARSHRKAASPSADSRPRR